jgi:hypothetical protein
MNSSQLIQEQFKKGVVKCGINPPEAYAQEVVKKSANPFGNS